MRRLITLLLLTVTAVSFGTAGAAAISWSDPIPNALPEVAGVVVEAVNCGGPAQADVGGIDFIANNGPAPLHSNINDIMPDYWEGPGVTATTGDAIRYTLTAKSEPPIAVTIPEMGSQIAGLRIVDLGETGPLERDGYTIVERWYELKADIVGFTQTG